MAKRWYAGPVVIIDGVRKPKVATYTFQDGVDAEGTPLIKPRFNHSSIMSSGQPGQRNDLAISLVEPRDGGTDFSLLEADSDMVDIAAEIRDRLGKDWEEADRHNWYNMTPREIGLNQGELNRVTKKMQDFGADTTGLTLDTTLGVFFARLADLINFGLDVRKVW